MLIKNQNPSSQKIQKFLVLIILTAIIVLVYYFGVLDYLKFEVLEQHQDKLNDFVSNNYILSVIIFLAGYIFAVALSLPIGTLGTIAAGYFFGIIGVFFVNIGATIGATINFLLARYLFGQSLQAKFDKQLSKFNQEIKENGPNYLLVLRLVPIFPFFVVNTLPGLTKIKLRVFVWTTAIGIIPGSFAYVYFGSTLKNIENPGDVISLEVLAAFILLSLISLIPVIIKKIKKNKLSDKT